MTPSTKQYKLRVTTYRKGKWVKEKVTQNKSDVPVCRDISEGYSDDHLKTIFYQIIHDGYPCEQPYWLCRCCKFYREFIHHCPLVPLQKVVVTKIKSDSTPPATAGCCSPGGDTLPQPAP